MGLGVIVCGDGVVGAGMWIDSLCVALAGIGGHSLGGNLNWLPGRVAVDGP